MLVVSISTDDYSAYISGVSEATGYTLYWSDNLVNEWGEWYTTLPQALIRLATLEHCSQTGQEFIHGERDFVTVADAFLKGTVNA